MKKQLVRFSCVVLLLICFLSGCSNSLDTENDIKMKQWLENAKLTAQETPEQLYEAALSESTLIVFSNSSRVLETKKAFESAYPGLTVEIRDIRSVDMIPMLRDSREKGEYLCDVIVTPDENNVLTDEFLPKGIVHRYCPSDIEKALLPDYNPSLLEFLGEGGILFYNTDASKEPPIANWWELTEPQWRGKICMANPLRSITTYTFLCATIQNSDEMQQAYKLRYGKDLAVPEGSNAAQEFWKMLLENDLKLAASSDEVAEFVGAIGQTEPVLGFMVSSKLRLEKIGYSIAPVYNITPSIGTYTPNVISVAGYAKNINATKLFIRFILGEADGQGEGYKPFLQKGTWSVRSDVRSETEIPLSDVDFWKADTEYISKNKEWIREFFTSLLEKRETN